MARDAMSTEMRACSGFDSHSARADSGSELVSMSSRQSSWSSTSHGLTAAVYISAARLWGVLVSERTKNAGSQARDSCLGEGVRGSVHERGRSRRGVQVSSCPGQQHAKSPGPQPVGLEAQQRRRRALSYAIVARGCGRDSRSAPPRLSVAPPAGDTKQCPKLPVGSARPETTQVRSCAPAVTASGSGEHSCWRASARQSPNAGSWAKALSTTASLAPLSRPTVAIAVRPRSSRRHAVLPGTRRDCRRVALAVTWIAHVDCSRGDRSALGRLDGKQPRPVLAPALLLRVFNEAGVDVARDVVPREAGVLPLGDATL